MPDTPMFDKRRRTIQILMIAGLIIACVAAVGITLLVVSSEGDKSAPSVSDTAADILAAAKTACAEKARETLKDPTSGQVRNLTGTEPGTAGLMTITGELNGKNSFGGYNGFKPFTCDATSDGTVASVLATSVEVDGDN